MKDKSKNTFWTKFTKALAPSLAPSSPFEKNSENYKKLVLIHVFSLLGIIAASFFGILRIYKGDAQLAILDFAYGATIAATYIFVKVTGKIVLASWAGVIQFAIFLVILLFGKTDGGSAYVWIFLFPPVTVYLLGHNQGIMVITIFLAVIVGLLALSNNFSDMKAFGFPFAFNLILALITISAVSFAFEFSRAKAHEKMRQARTIAEKASSMKSEFLANISHEVRTPMNGIIGLLDILSATDINKEQAEYLNLLTDTAEQSLSILNELLDISKAEAGKLDIEPKSTDIIKLAKELFATYKPKVEQKGICLKLKVPESLPRVMIDPKRIRQILHNFINNAVKYTKRGFISLKIDKIRELNGESLELRFSVEDTGDGIAEEQTESIFEAFVQADGAYTRQQGGTGLGLAISKKIVQLMRGDIGYSHADAGGSIFWFQIRMPVCAQTDKSINSLLGQQQLESTEEAEDGSTLSGRVLLVEDNPVNRLVTTAMISRLGIEILQADDGIKALEILSTHNVDAILMDVQMPGMDGFQTTAEIRKNEKYGQNIPIIALTAHAMKEDRDRCLRQGMDDYLSKPFSEGALRNVLKRHLPSRTST